MRRDNGDTNARYSQGVLNQFSRYMKDLGFPKGVGFHAFRHTLATELHHMGVAEEDIALVTGHSISKRVPVLHEAYFHKKPAQARTKQIAALEKYRPDVVLPVYQAGQFRAAPGGPKQVLPVSHLAKMSRPGRARDFPPLGSPHTRRLVNRGLTLA